MPTQIGVETPRKPLRLWPGVVAVALQWLVSFVVPLVIPGAGGIGIFAGAAGGLLVLVWWLFFSRAPWTERVGAIALIVVAVLVTLRIVHPSIATAMMGLMLPIYSIPFLSLALVASVALSRHLSIGPRFAVMAAAFLLALSGFMLVRTGGITGDADADIHWRWTETPEERLLARARDERVVPPSAPIAAETPAPASAVPASGEPTPAVTDAAPAETPTKTVPAPATAEPTARPAAPAEANADAAPSAATRTRADWPGFRGPERNDIVRGVQIQTDWSQSPPVELWRRPIGPAWSSFAVGGNRIYTQEQRGDDEIVSCYDLATGEPVWRHRDAARFWESNAGAGPRGTPTLSNGRVYTFGATGILNALDARNGSVVWSRNAAADTDRKIPDWGFASSPLVVDGVVIVAAASALAAYDVATGKPRWFGPKDGWGYSSPHLSTIDGVTQVVLLNGSGAIGVAPSDGALLWKYDWPSDGIVQPALLAGGDILIGSGSGLAGKSGMSRVTVAHDPNGWNVKERWTSTGLKPYFNDFVVHEGHAYGFDGSLLASVDLADGARKWKGGRYGHGQLVVLSDQDLLLVLSEEGELALVKASPDRYTEVARFKAIEGKTWNHPVLVGDVLLVRNSEEMAAFRLSLAGS